MEIYYSFIGSDLIKTIASYIVTIIQGMGYTGIFIAMIIESACIPLSSEVILLFSGFMVKEGVFQFWYVVAAGVMGNIIGSIITYLVGSNGGRTFLIRYGKYFLFNKNHLEKAEEWFLRYGEWGVFFGRNLPVIRTFISLPAGVARMGFGKFVLFSFWGCIPWNIALTYAGFKLGENWYLLESYTLPFTIAIAIILVLLFFWYLYKASRRNKR